MGKTQYDADSITVLEGLEAVRKRPGMYIGSVGTKGLNHLIYEIVDNSVDEHLAGACSQIRVTLEADGSCTVRDNGRGIPVEMHKKGVAAERIVLSTLHAASLTTMRTRRAVVCTASVRRLSTPSQRIWRSIYIRMDRSITMRMSAASRRLS